MLFKIIIWGALGYIVYSWFQDRMKLREGERKTTIRHRDHGKKEQNKKSNDDDYIDYEELK